MHGAGGRGETPALRHILMSHFSTTTDNFREQRAKEKKKKPKKNDPPKQNPPNQSQEGGQKRGRGTKLSVKYDQFLVHSDLRNPTSAPGNTRQYIFCLLFPSFILTIILSTHKHSDTRVYCTSFTFPFKKILVVCTLSDI